MNYSKQIKREHLLRAVLSSKRAGEKKGKKGEGKKKKKGRGGGEGS